MAGPPVTSPDAFSFAADFVEYERQQREEKERLTKNAEKATQVKAVSDPKEVVGTADYGKFTRLSKELAAEEAREEEIRKQEAAQANAMAAGCGHDHSKERQLFERPTLEKIQAADRFRREGNAAFKEQNFGLAAVNYRKALLQFDYTFPSTPEEEELFEKSKLPCHLNLAACKLQLRDFEEVYIQCRLALQLDPKNCKAFYRRGMAEMMQDHLDEAQQSFTAALEIEPSNSHVISALKELRTKKVNYQRTSVNTYKKMFQRNPKQQNQQKRQPQQNLQQPEQQQQQSSSGRSEAPEAPASPHHQDGGNESEQQTEFSPEQQQLQQQTEQQQQLRQQQKQHEEQQQPKDLDVSCEEPMHTNSASVAPAATPAMATTLTAAGSEPRPLDPLVSCRSSPAARAAAPAETISDEGCRCEGPCPCSGEMPKDYSRGRGFDPQSALRLILEGGAPRGLREASVGGKTRMELGIVSVAAAVCAASVVCFYWWCCGDKSLSPTTVAAITAAAVAAKTAGPWVVGGALLLALVLAGWLLVGDSSETGSGVFLTAEDDDFCSNNNPPCDTNIQQRRPYHHPD